ncbi:hypothetical protein OS493_015672 [Desmophyllum pertusum]|uniref:Uncharacterized protein n=1 Tax=Desmophyllum pertusum TaxID=174260 RepID=A0A9W9YPG2_9CNID|nr:hypothetical protein OS493_015672 [Desmophyllum pertusum]
MEIVQLESAIDDLRDQMEEVWISYHNDREWWKQRADKVLGRRPKSAPPRRRSAVHKVARHRPAPAGEEQAPKETKEHGDTADGSPGHMSAPEVSPDLQVPLHRQTKNQASSFIVWY